MTSLSKIVMIGVLSVVFGALVIAQQPPVPAAARPAPSQTQLTLQVVVSKHQGDKKINNVPYVMSVVANSNQRGSLRMGTRLPIVTQSVSAASAPPVFNIEYADVGVGIDCTAHSVEDGRYRLDLTVEDNSVLAEPPAGAKSGDRPVFRTFKASETILLRDGQSAQFTAATDKLTGEVTKVDVTLTVGK